MVRSTSLLLILGLLLPSLSACATGMAGRVPPSEAAGSNRQYVGVTTVEGKEVPFERARPPERVGGVLRPGVQSPRIEGDSLFATVDGAPYRIALTDAREVWFDDKRISWARTGLLVGGIVVGLSVLTYIGLRNASGETCLGNNCSSF